MEKVSIQKIPVFKAGNYGEKGNYSVKDLKEIADNYDPSFLEAAISTDHVQKGPRKGYVERVYFENGILYTDMVIVDPEFYQQLRASMYEARSVELYTNLNSKGKYLKAVTFLGVAPPEVKGLPKLEIFTDDVGEYLIYEYKKGSESMKKDRKKEILTSMGDMLNREEIDFLESEEDDDNKSKVLEMKYDMYKKTIKKMESQSKKEGDRKMSDEKKPLNFTETPEFVAMQAKIKELEEQKSKNEAVIQFNDADLQFFGGDSIQKTLKEKALNIFLALPVDSRDTFISFCKSIPKPEIPKNDPPVNNLGEPTRVSFDPYDQEQQTKFAEAVEDYARKNNVSFDQAVSKVKDVFYL